MAGSEKTKQSWQNKADKKIKSGVKRKAKRKVKKIHPITFVICFLCLVLGIGVGAASYSFASKDDTFKLRGDAYYTLPVGAPFMYKDEGVRIIEFGKDISSNVEIKTNLDKNEEGYYTADTSKPGDYYIEYTVDSVKYGNVKRIRTISVRGDS